MLKSDLLVLNEDLWMREEKHVILNAVSVKDKDAERAGAQHRSCSAMGKQRGSVLRAATAFVQRPTGVVTATCSRSRLSP